MTPTLLTLVMIAGADPEPPAYTPEARIAVLEAKVATLEKKVASLQKSPTINATTVTVPGPVASAPPTWTGKNVQSAEGIWFNLMSDGSLRLCQECNQGQVVLQSSGGQVVRYSGDCAGGCANCPTGSCSSAGACGTPGCGSFSYGSAGGGSEFAACGQSSGRPGLLGRLFGGRCR